VDALKVHIVPLNEFGDRVTGIKILLSGNPDYVVSFIRRQANRVIHSIDRVALSHPNPHIFYEVPHTLYSLIINDMQ